MTYRNEVTNSRSTRPKPARLLICLIAFGTALTFFGGPATSTSQAEENGTPTSIRRALLIGNTYQETAQPLPNAAQDVTTLKYLLLKSRNDLQGNPFSPDNIVTKTDLSKSEILAAIESAFIDATEDDVSLFYFTGHGGYVVGHGSVIFDNSFSFLNFIDTDELTQALSAIPGKVIVLIDSCQSGGFIERGGERTEPEAINQGFIDAFTSASAPTRSLTGPKFFVLTASSSTQLAYSGIFMDFLLQSTGFSYGFTYLFGSPNQEILTLQDAYSFIDTHVWYYKPFNDVQIYPENSDFPLFYFPDTLIASPETWYPPQSGASTTAEVMTYVSWTASSDAPSWLSVSSASGTGDATLTLTTSQNLGQVGRTGTITITAGLLSATITVTQTGPPPVLSNPVMTGNAMVGHTLSVAASVNPIDSLLTYKWYRGCGTGSAIAGATASTYVVQPEDVSESICAKVTASKLPNYGETSKFSNDMTISPASSIVFSPVGPVAPGAPLTVTWSAYPANATSTVTECYFGGKVVTISYNLSGSSVYTSTAADIGKAIVCKMTIIAPSFSPQILFSNAVDVLEPEASVNLSPVGPVTPGTPVTMTLNTFPSNAFVLAEWYVGSTVVMLAIDPPNGTFYTPTSADIGKAISVKLTLYVPSLSPLVFFSNAVNVDSVALSPVGPVTPGTPVTMTVDTFPSNAFVLAEWYVGSTVVMLTINPSSGTFYTPTSTDIGEAIYVRLTVYNSPSPAIIKYSNSVNVV